MRFFIQLIWLLQFNFLQKVYRFSHKISLALMNYGIGAHYNGEEYIFKKLATHFREKKVKPVVFDVGANFWQTIILFDKLFTGASIHSFEPWSFSYSQIKDSKLQNSENNLKVNNFGLSDVKGDTILFTSSTKEMSWSSSMYEENLDVFTSEKSIKETISLTTLDQYCQENNISKIDFLKLDIEGNKYNCFVGAKKNDRRMKDKFYTIWI